jgi:putative membrane protein
MDKLFKKEKPESPLEVTLKGMAAGLAGTAVLTVFRDQAPKVLEALGMQAQQEPGDTKSRQGAKQAKGEDTPQDEDPPSKLAEKISEGVFEEPLGETEKRVAGQAIHWAYGAGWGALYGIVQGSIRMPHWLHGTLLGGLVGLIAATVVPGMKLMPPPDELPPPQRAMGMAMPMLFGWTTAFFFRLFSRSQH